jgi:large subunit ribosomal protein L10
MPKTKLQKEGMLTALTDRLGRSQGVVLVGTSGIKVDEIEQIRDTLFTHGLQFQVAKNSLLKLALEENKMSVPAELLDQPLGLVYSYADPVAAAALTVPFKKEIEKLQVLGGLVGNEFMSADQVVALSKLPSREQLLGQLVGTLQAPISGFVNVLAGNIRGLVTVLGAIRDTKAA